MEVNMIGECEKPKYKKSEASRETISLLTCACIGFLSIDNYDYLEITLESTFQQNGITVIILKLLCTTLMAYPWVSSCIFIGQYTKRQFNVVRHMAPIFRFVIMIQPIFSVMFAGTLDSMPPLTKLWKDLTNIDGSVMEMCTARMEEQDREQCRLGKPFKTTLQCYFEEQNILDRAEMYYSMIDQYYGIVAVFLMLAFGIRIYTYIVKRVLLFTVISQMVTFLLSLLYITPVDIFSAFLHREPDKGLDMNEVYAFLGNQIRSLVTATPTLVALGSYLPTKYSPIDVAVRITAFELFYVIFQFVVIMSNFLVVSHYFRVKVACLQFTYFYESVLITGVTAIQIMYQNQGENFIKMVIYFNTVLFRFIEICYLSAQVLGPYLTLIAMYKSLLKNSRVRHLILLFLLSVLIHITSYCRAPRSSIVVLHYFSACLYVVCSVFSLTYTISVFFAYGVRRLRIDSLFLYGERVSSSTIWLYRIVPIVTILFYIYTLFYTYSHEKFYNVKMIKEDENKVNKTPFYIFVNGFFILIMLSVIICSAQRLSRRCSLNYVFMPSKEWGPWSPDGVDLKAERRKFHPDTATKFEGNYYRCVHNCWLDNEVIAKEIHLCNYTNELIRKQIKQVNLRRVAPKEYREYYRGLSTLQ